VATNGGTGEAASRLPLLDSARARLPSLRLSVRSRWLAGSVALTVVVGALVVGMGRTSAFAVQKIEVSGASPRDTASVRKALAPLVGRSLASVDAGDVLGPLRALPVVTSAAYDRAFPHTLRVFVRTERPLAVLRRGARSWLVSVHGRVLKPLPSRSALRLPRIWLGPSAEVRAGSFVTGGARVGVLALTPLAGRAILHRVRSAVPQGREVALTLRSGLELRLGRPTSVPLKLAIAQRIAPSLDTAGRPAYLDLTVPNRVVAGALKSQVEPRG
jgi:cell division protein FtsQ